ncbi:FAD-dependent oxidoreductase [Pseudooceanicola lipolyticus]|uniref:FAD-dependent oxidoreductase n=1 Tax=Pseudooceanicola lipolyticus TaxID=2029104 RepID=A0A2M8J3G3_9RHOB|nr:FAD-binding oxidoreductase [Pseudooceanicola lipolyticus]PJE37312.1 FAD-dependent oxidoreductase [Pseudooceanicola lipolyticus]
MKRIFSGFAYGDAPRDGCWWPETVTPPDWPQLQGERKADVAIIGGGFTGLSAALHLAEAGARVAVLEARSPGWGASGRNGGFCCIGGAMRSHAQIERSFGAGAAEEFWQAQQDAVALVAALIDRFGIKADTHSQGETQLAHRPRDMDALRAQAEALGPDKAQLIEPEDLAAQGMAGPFHGALTLPWGFALNPLKYLFGLAAAARSVGAQLFQRSEVTGIDSLSGRYRLRTNRGQLRARQVIVATNGYSSEDVPNWLAGRYMPAQSNVLVTRPMTGKELQAQGWTSAQMAYDTRGLLHYFRLMPDRRFLFGMRGGLLSSPAAEARARARTRAHFEAMFPAWAHVESPYLWSGMVCLSRRRVPFAGPVPNQPGLFAGLAYHGNGVAMGTYTGKLLAGLVQGTTLPPRAMRGPLDRFPLGAARRILMPPFYLASAIGDR